MQIFHFTRISQYCFSWLSHYQQTGVSVFWYISFCCWVDVYCELCCACSCT